MDQEEQAAINELTEKLRERKMLALSRQIETLSISLGELGTRIEKAVATLEQMHLKQLENDNRICKLLAANSELCKQIVNT